jgi:hypothetical protein
LSRAVGDEFERFLNTGRVSNWNKFTAKRVRYSHRVNWTQNNPLSLDFFNVQPAPNVCNLPTTGTLLQDQALALQAIRVTIIPTPAVVTGTAAVAVPEACRNLIQNGTFLLRVGDRDVVTSAGVIGLDAFPSGGGPSIDAAFAGTGPFLAYNVVNGLPVASNAWQCSPWFPVLPGRQIAGRVTWPAAYDAGASNVINCRVDLEGVLITPANN